MFLSLRLTRCSFCLTAFPSLRHVRHLCFCHSGNFVVTFKHLEAEADDLIWSRSANVRGKCDGDPFQQ